jgi:hypothetical protein
MNYLFLSQYFLTKFPSLMSSIKRCHDPPQHVLHIGLRNWLYFMVFEDRVIIENFQSNIAEN